jgi:hypothetical protein
VSEPEMKRLHWYLILGGSLFAVSILAYLLQVVIFHRIQDTIFYLLQDLAFIPIQVLVVTLVLNNLLVRREKQAILRKLNMVIGAFFTEVGTTLLDTFARFDKNAGSLIVAVNGNDWSTQACKRLEKYVHEHDYQIDSQRADLDQLKALLLGKRTFLLSLLENPNLLEHDSFTELLLAVFHLTEELALRADVHALPQADYQHLAGDIKRAFVLLISEWLSYVEHLREDYPYIFSLIVRTNPFDPSASPIIK